MFYYLFELFIFNQGVLSWSNTTEHGAKNWDDEGWKLHILWPSCSCVRFEAHVGSLERVTYQNEHFGPCESFGSCVSGIRDWYWRPKSNTEVLAKPEGTELRKYRLRGESIEWGDEALFFFLGSVWSFSTTIWCPFCTQKLLLLALPSSLFMAVAERSLKTGIVIFSWSHWYIHAFLFCGVHLVPVVRTRNFSMYFCSRRTTSFVSWFWNCRTFGRYPFMIRIDVQLRWEVCSPSLLQGFACQFSYQKHVSMCNKLLDVGNS